MTQRSLRIDSYRLMLFNKNDSQPASLPLAIMMSGLIDAKPWNLYASFMNDPVVEAISEQEHPDWGKVAFIWLPAANHAPLADMLRNEKPVYVRWDTGNSRIHFQTLQEPVGEGEIVIPKGATAPASLRAAGGKRKSKSKSKKR